MPEQTVFESFGEFIEDASDATGKTWLVRVITPGWGASGYYSRSLLKEAASTAVPQYTHMYLDHEGTGRRSVRSVRDQVGYMMEDAYWDEAGPKGAGVYAKAHIFEDRRTWLKERSQTTGISITGVAEFENGTAEGRKGKIFKAFPMPVDSADIVSKAGRGGAFVSVP